MRSLVFKIGDRGYVYRGSLYYVKTDFQVKNEVVGYVEENGKRKGVVIDLGKVREARDLFVDGYVDDLSSNLLADGKGNVYVWVNSPRLPMGSRFDVVEGVPIRKGDTRSLIKVMSLGETFVKYALSVSQNEEVLMEAVRKSSECRTVLQVFNKLQSFGREEALAAASCMEKEGMLREAARLYERFDEVKANELRRKLREEADRLISSGDLKAMAKAMELCPDYPEPAVKIGLELMRRGKTKEAIDYLIEAVKRGESLRNLSILGWALLKAGKEEEALRVLDRADALRRTPGIAFLRGIILEKVSPSKASKEFAFACSEGIAEACTRVVDVDDELEGTTLYGYHLRKLVGDGGMGKVYLAERKSRKFAMKVMKEDSKPRETLQEVAKLQQLSQHPNVIRIVGSYINDEYDPNFPPAIVTEYMEGGDLTNILVSKEYATLRGSVSWPQVVSHVFKEQAAALIHLHSNGYVHCDFKPSNVLFNVPLPYYGVEALDSLSTGKVVSKLSDLGSSVRIGEPVIHYTPFYAHPLQRFGVRADTTLDIYSLGVSLYVSLTGKYPTPDWLERELESAASGKLDKSEALREFHRAEPELSQVPPELRTVVYGALKQELTMEEIHRELKSFSEYEFPVELSKYPSSNKVL
ncbi:serine/threonine protein kinase [Sulfodiicoccus acidiphilus]|uniref:Serine/threonine protein kinase n=1 Tax=Sulfodiicoccus acidiphilus TaxID=1670455 RepID=A0A348B2I4_9CREN|nr:protein kinase [Sulfodiicoccus acidiphilus]BBD72386.1 serine/threonine protein kinase [Sulfodiicoccus acidiphilus]GGT97482.1 serine/threonine protein kinase [Sulfodiicoccus acidiphilus]